MTQPCRVAGHGRIDRSRQVEFLFDRRRYAGHPGDTLAAALLANGVHLVGRSFKYHRPRGILSAGVEEPNALVQLYPGTARSTPNLRATQIELHDGLFAESQNRWPSLEHDLGAVADWLSPFLPAGFYYKTFMGPRGFWPFYERLIRRAAGLGRSPDSADPDRYEHRHAHCDVLIAGGGPAGLAAALAAGRAGARVILADERAELGGSLLAERDGALIDGQIPAAWLEAVLAELRALPEVTLLARTTVAGYYHQNFLTAAERVTDHLPPGSAPPGVPRQRLWQIRARQVVLATGAIERPLVFAGNDRPGIMLAGAVRCYLNQYGVRAGSRVLVFTADDAAYQTALDLHRAGIAVVAIVDLRTDPDGPLVAQARRAGLDVMTGHAVVATEGRQRVAQARVRRLAATGFEAGKQVLLECDAIAMSGGWSPAVHLFSQSMGRLAFDEGLGGFVPGAPFQATLSAGACAGPADLAGALAQGLAAGARAAAETGHGTGAPPAAPVVEAPRFGRPGVVWQVPPERPSRDSRAFVDLQNDVMVKDLKLAVREGYRSVEHMKRYTTAGLGTDQGKTGNLAAFALTAEAQGQRPAAAGHTTFRPPYSPVGFGTIAGRNIGPLYAPARLSPIHDWHKQHGAVFENVGGQWRRPWYYPRPGESMAQAVRREVLAARNGLAVLDASTLGKIDVRGPDAAELLNRVYTNAWSKLAVGGCRYGLMLGEDGMVIDDGVTTRLADDHFHMTTTTGGAARIMAWLEEWLQTEWPDLRVFLTSVTEQWAVISLAGPQARSVLQDLTQDIDLAPDAFPHLQMRQGHVAGVPARVFRISFTGELSYEINVPASFGLAVWRAVMAAGERYDATPFGTEAMHVARAEKGYIIVGQETDGTVTPFDLGMDWIVSRTKPDFLGKRALQRSDLQRSDRKQLVGLLAEDPAVVLEEGAQLVATTAIEHRPVPMLGHVTSSYLSPTLGRGIAMALVRGGRAKMGETVHVVQGDRPVAARITSPVFYDPEGTRLHG